MDNPISFVGDRFSDLGSSVRRAFNQIPQVQVSDILEHGARSHVFQKDQPVPAPNGQATNVRLP